MEIKIPNLSCVSDSDFSFVTLIGLSKSIQNTYLFNKEKFNMQI